MQSKIVLQSNPLAADYSPKESKAESEASQRDHLKPSECKVGDKLYRYEANLVSAGVDQWDESLGSYMELYCWDFEVIKITPAGAMIQGLDQQRLVLDHYINKFAYPTKAEALLGFIARKRRQQSILMGQLARSKQAQSKAEQLLEKELKCSAH